MGTEVQDASRHSRRWSAAWFMILAALMTTVVVTTSAQRAHAAGVATVSKVLDSAQGTGFTAPNTFATGALVRYRLVLQCSSFTEDCVTGTLTDVLDPNLEFVEVIPPTSTGVQVTGSYNAGTHAVTMNVTNFGGGDQAEVVLVARVRSSTPGGTVIPNSASITVPGQPAPNVSGTVTIQVPAPMPQWHIDKVKFAPTGSPGVGANVSYRVVIWSDSPVGNVPITGGTVVDTYPVGATVVSADGGSVDAVNHTITWTVPAVDPDVLAQGNNTLVFKNVVLSYPAPTFSAGQTVVNHVLATFNYADGTSGQSSDSEPVTLRSTTTSSTLTKTGPSSVTRDQTGISYRVQWTNDGDTPIPGVIVTDTFPTGITITNFSRVSTWPQRELFFEALVGGSWQLVFHRNASAANTVPNVNVSIPAGATAFRVRAGEPLAAGEFISFDLAGTLNPDVPTTLVNCASVVVDAGNAPPNSCVTTTVVEPFTQLSATKRTVYADGTSAKPGDEVQFVVIARVTAGSDINQVNLSDILPPQFEYVRTDCVVAGPRAQTDPAYFPCRVTPPPLVINPTVTSNFNGTSTLLNWDIDMTQGIPATFQGGVSITTLSLTGNVGGAVAVRFTARVKPGTAVATYTNDVRTTSDVRPVTCASDGVVDTLDVNQNGNTTELVCRATSNVIVSEAAVLGGEKWDDGFPGLDHVDQSTGQPNPACPDWEGFTRYPCVAQTVPGGSFSYRWRLQNYGNVALTNYAVYDILPHIGDVGATQTLSSTSRGTEWQPVLAGPVVIESQPSAANAVIQYNLTNNPCRPEMSDTGAVWQASCDDTWYTAAQITDWSTVRSFRLFAFRQADGVWPAWQPADSIVLNAPMTAPAGAPTSTSTPLDLSIAWNSVGHSAFRLNANQTTSRLLASEPRKVGIIIPFTENLPDLVRLGNQVWLDSGAGSHFDNGVYDTDETPISGVVVELWEDDGDGIFDPAVDTFRGTTTTDADGNYWFVANADTPYFVAIPAGQTGQNGGTLDLGDLVSSTGAGTGTVDNDDNGTPQSGYAAVSDVRRVSVGGAPTGEQDTNDAGSAEAEADANVTPIADADSDLTIDFGFRPNIYDLALIKTRVTASPVQPGADVVWQIRVANQGAVPSGDFTVTDTLPAGLGFVSASDSGSHNAGIVTWNLTGLAPGASRVLTLTTRVDDVNQAPYRNWAEISSDSGDDVDSTPDTNTGSDNGPGTGTGPNDQVTNHNDPNFENNTETPLPGGATDEDDNDYEDVDVTIVYDLALAKVTSATSVDLGDNITWTIRVQNQGNVPSLGYTITDRIPAGLTFVSCAGATTCSNASGVVTYTMPSLAPGSFADVTLITSVTDMNFQPFRNWAEISADGADGYDIPGVRDVADKDSTPDTITGSDNAYGPALNATDNGGANDNYVGITDLATIATDGLPDGDEDDHDDAIVGGNVRYDLALIKTASASTVAPGGTITWTISVKNQGNVDSHLYDVTDTLPAGMTYVSSSPAGTLNGQVLTWTDLANLTPGETRTITIVTRADDMTQRPFRNWAEISADSASDYNLPGLTVTDDDSTPDTNTGSDNGSGTGTGPNDQVTNHNDPNFDNNTETPLPGGATDEDDNDYEDVDGTVVYDLALVKTVDNVSPVQPGDVVTWRILVKNQGNVPSLEFTVTDRLPTGMAYATCSGGTSCAETGGVVRWTVADLAPGEVSTLVVTSTIVDTSRGTYRNWAEVSHDSSDTYATTDKDSTPDVNTGHDSTAPNDDYVPQDAADIDADQTPGDEDDNDDAVVTLVGAQTSLTKTVGQPVDRGDGTAAVTYTVTVTNIGPIATAYTLDDHLRFAPGIAISSVSATSPGIVVSASWNGVTDTRVVTDQAIDVGARHVYTVVAVVALPTTRLTGSTSNCALEQGESGTALYNQATVIAETTHDATACAPTDSLPEVSPPTTSTTPTTPQPTAPPGGLPKAGAAPGTWAMVALGALVVGAMLLIVRRRRQPA